MKKTGRLTAAELDDPIDEITTDANGDDEQLSAFRQAFEDNLKVPFEGSVLGEPVAVLGFDYDGNDRRGLTATCRAMHGRDYVMSAASVTVDPAMDASRYLAAYRKWMGDEPYPSHARPKQSRRPAPAQRATASVEVVVLSVGPKAASCRRLGSSEVIQLRVTSRLDAVPGEIAVIRPNRTDPGLGRLLGEIESTRIDVDALQLVPLKLHAFGTWDPARDFWNDGGPIARWAKPIIQRGPRPQFEMEQVLPGLGPDEYDPDADPIGRAVDTLEAGDKKGAYQILMDLCQADLRCLDAHAHLGNIAFERNPELAIRHYEVGVRIGELSLGKQFDGVLNWGLIDNRPFLRCMHGYGLCHWRLGRSKDAAQIFKRMLWLNPGDNQGARFLVEDIRAKLSWEDRSEY